MENLMRIRLFEITCIALIFVIVGCGTAQRQQPIAVEKGKGEVQMEARDFAFEPSVIKLSGDTLTLKINNVTGTEHNITVKDPQGKVLADRDLPPHQVTMVNLKFPASGIYEVSCDKTFHASLGMKGRIEVTR